MNIIIMAAEISIIFITAAETSIIIIIITMAAELSIIIIIIITAAPGAMTFPAQGQPAIPQPGYFASALRGQALQYAATSAAATAQSVAMPGPGFFSTVTSTVASVPQSAIVTALSGSTGVGTQAQPIPVIGGECG